jgi:hypothetical protein
LYEAFFEDFRIDFRDTQAVTGTVKALDVIVKPEYMDRAVYGAKGFKAFKYALPVVDGAKGRINSQRTIGHDPRFIPFPIAVIHPQHMIGENLAKNEIIEIYIFDPGGSGFSDGNTHFFILSH